jgi:aryl-alcohol dehydrogenase-like predicted oxidoreductase
MNFFCVENVPNSGYIQLQEEGKIGCLFAGRNHLAHNRQFQRRQEKSRLPENVARLAEVYSLPPLPDDSLMIRDVEKNGVLQTCEELGIGFVPWGPVGQGYLTRKIDAETRFDPKLDMRSTFPRFSPETISANTPIIELVKEFAEKKKATAAQLSLAWLLARKPFIVPIPGTRNIDHLNENLGAVNVQLTPEDIREIDSAFSTIEVHGGRMNEEQMKVVDQTK